MCGAAGFPEPCCAAGAMGMTNGKGSSAPRAGLAAIAIITVAIPVAELRAARLGNGIETGPIDHADDPDPRSAGAVEAGDLVGQAGLT